MIDQPWLQNPAQAVPRRPRYPSVGSVIALVCWICLVGLLIWYLSVVLLPFFAQGIDKMDWMGMWESPITFPFGM